jgi:hypothetical protein
VGSRALLAPTPYLISSPSALSLVEDEKAFRMILVKVGSFSCRDAPLF